MDIYSELKKDHQEVRKLLDRLSKGNGKTLQDDFEKLEMQLTAHTKAEDGVFYSRLAESEETRELIQEGREEHHMVDVLLKEMSKLDTGDEQWSAKMSVLKEQVEHHLKEEESEMFKKAKSVIKSDEAQQLAKDFEREKKRYL